MIIPFPTVLPDELTHAEAAQRASTAGLHLVIDRDGNTLITPILLPGMQRMASADKQAAPRLQTA